MYLILITLKGLLPVLGPMDKTDVVISMQYGTILANQIPVPPSRNTVFLQNFWECVRETFWREVYQRKRCAWTERGRRPVSGTESVKNWAGVCLDHPAKKKIPLGVKLFLQTWVCEAWLWSCVMSVMAAGAPKISVSPPAPDPVRLDDASWTQGIGLSVVYSTSNIMPHILAL